MAEITHATVGRINVERGEDTVTVKLWQWSLKPDATLTHDEARMLIRRLQAALAPPKVRGASAPDEEDPYDVG